jgi:hypothetical protein
MAIGLATTVQADPDPDVGFLAALNNAGITYQNGADAIAIGRRACQLMTKVTRKPTSLKA